MINDIKNLFVGKPKISGPLEVVRAVHVNKKLEWEIDPSVDPRTVFLKMRIIGKGGFGTVAQIVHRPSGKILAGKLINVKILNKIKSKNELKNEIDLLRMVDSPYTVHYFGTVPLEGSLMILMEYCDRGSLRDILDARQQVLSEDQISIVMRDMLRGLRLIHMDHHIVHRDIKAANILLTSKSEVKIADFGVSRKFESNGINQTMTIVGTPYWMAPEVICGMPYSYPADIWSVGITAVELSEGSPPYAEFAPTKAMIEIAIKGFPGYRFASMHSPELCDFVSHCTQSDPNDRWTIAQLLEHPFIKRAERLNRLEAMDTIIRPIKSRQIPGKNPQNNNNNNGNDDGDKNDNKKNVDIFNVYTKTDTFKTRLCAKAANLPTGRNFSTPDYEGKSFEGMAMLMSQKFDTDSFDFGTNNFTNNDINNSIEGSSSGSDFGGLDSGEHNMPSDSFDDISMPFEIGVIKKADNAKKNKNNINNKGSPFAQNRNQAIDSFGDLNIPFAQVGGNNDRILKQSPREKQTQGGISEDNSNREPKSDMNSPQQRQQKKKEFSGITSCAMTKKPGEMQVVPDQIFVKVSRAMSVKIPFVPFVLKEDEKNDSSKRGNKFSRKNNKNGEKDIGEDDDEIVDERILKAREKLRKTPVTAAVTIVLLFFFCFQLTSIFCFFGAILSVTMLYEHFKYHKQLQKGKLELPDVTSKITGDTTKL